MTERVEETRMDPGATEQVMLAVVALYSRQVWKVPLVHLNVWKEWLK